MISPSCVQNCQRTESNFVQQSMLSGLMLAGHVPQVHQTSSFRASSWLLCSGRPAAWAHQRLHRACIGALQLAHLLQAFVRLRVSAAEDAGALRMEDCAEAWEGMPRSDNVRSFMQRMSSDKLRRLESALQRSPSLTVPSEVGRPACSRNARNMSCHLIRLPGQCHPRHLTDALLSKTSGLLVHVVKDVTTGICGRSADGTELKSSAWCSHSF